MAFMTVTHPLQQEQPVLRDWPCDTRKDSLTSIPPRLLPESMLEKGMTLLLGSLQHITCISLAPAHQRRLSGVLHQHIRGFLPRPLGKKRDTPPSTSGPLRRSPVTCQPHCHLPSYILLFISILTCALSLQLDCPFSLSSNDASILTVDDLCLSSFSTLRYYLYICPFYSFLTLPSGCLRWLHFNSCGAGVSRARIYTFFFFAILSTTESVWAVFVRVNARVESGVSSGVRCSRVFVSSLWRDAYGWMGRGASFGLQLDRLLLQ